MLSFNLRKSFLYSVDVFSAVLFGIGTLVILARYFSKVEVAHLATTQSACALLAFLITLGLDQFLAREFSKGKGKGCLLGVLIIQSILFFPYVGLVYFVLQFGEKISLFNVLVVACGFAFSISNPAKIYLQAHNLAEKCAQAAIFSRLVGLFFLLFLVVSGADYSLCLLYLPVQSALFFFINVYHARELIGDGVGVGETFRLIREAFPVLAASVIYPVYMYADNLILSFFGAGEKIAIYAPASKIVIQLFLIGQIVSLTFYKHLTSRVDFPEEFSRYCKALGQVYFFIAILTVFSVFLLSDVLILFLFGSGFSDSSGVLRILCLTLLFSIPGALFSRLLIITRNSKIELYKSLITASVCVAANLLFVPLFGIHGAAVASVLSYFVADFLSYFLFRETRVLVVGVFCGYLDLFVSPVFALRNIVSTLKSVPL
ncbi:polysaccharide biosynthesis C-terminal domain-containing protein [Uliginosibacterium paludis]|uniref:Polysaccharide biosynthesis C-terminal domain-containing protein n=1 Tax=Uliginosibacterium paludis TaxID=1615952 RepID=A0ABV2CVE6_9RHOO